MCSSIARIFSWQYVSHFSLRTIFRLKDSFVFFWYFFNLFYVFFFFALCFQLSERFYDRIGENHQVSIWQAAASCGPKINIRFSQVAFLRPSNSPFRRCQYNFTYNLRLSNCRYIFVLDEREISTVFKIISSLIRTEVVAETGRAGPGTTAQFTINN